MNVKVGKNLGRISNPVGLTQPTQLEENLKALKRKRAATVKVPVKLKKQKLKSKGDDLEIEDIERELDECEKSRNRSNMSHLSQSMTDNSQKARSFAKTSPKIAENELRPGLRK